MKNRDVLILFVLTVSVFAAAAWSLTSSTSLFSTAIRIVSGAAIVLILPGYLLTLAILPHYHFSWYERLLFSLALSLAVSVLAGVVLNMTDAGMEPTTWLLMLGVITFGSFIVLFARTPASFRVMHSVSIKPMDVILLLVAVGIGGYALHISQIGATAERKAFTQLWIMNDASETDGVRIGIHNEEKQPLQYHLVLKSGDKILHEWPSVMIDADETWEETLSVPDRKTLTEPVQAVLYRLDFPTEIYRWVSLSS